MDNKTVEQLIEKIKHDGYEYQTVYGFHSFFDFLAEDLEEISLQCAELKKQQREESVKLVNIVREQYQKDVADLQAENESLKKLIASDSVYQALRIVWKSPSQLTAEDDSYCDLYNISTELRKNPVDPKKE